MKNIILYLKGILIGIGKIIPGVSGSIIAMTLKIYEPAIEKISNLNKNIIENIKYLIPIALGVLTSIILGSNIIIYLLKNYYIQTMYLFIGLIIGTIPGIYRKIEHKNKYFYPIILLITFFTLQLLNINPLPDFIYKNNIISNIQITIIGLIEAFTMIFPGISTTSTFMILGYYNFILNTLKDLPILLFKQPLIVINYGLSIIIGILISSKIINYLIKKYNDLTYTIILSFVIISLYILFLMTLKTNFQLNELITGIILLIFGSYISLKFE